MTQDFCFSDPGGRRAGGLRRKFAAKRQSGSHGTYEASSDEDHRPGILELSPERASQDLSEEDFVLNSLPIPNRKTSPHKLKGRRPVSDPNKLKSRSLVSDPHKLQGKRPVSDHVNQKVEGLSVT